MISIFLKIRYVVEQKIGHVKTQTLNTVRNRRLGHYAQDLRISCAINNFNMLYKGAKENNADHNEIIKVQQLKIKCLDNRQKNSLDFLVADNFMLYLNRKTRYKVEILKKVKDFPILSINEINKSVSYSNYQSKMSRSYLSEFRKLNKCYYMQRNLMKSIPDKEILNSLSNKKTRLIVFQMPSRHSRGKSFSKAKCQAKKEIHKKLRTLHRVAIHYVPFHKTFEGILGKIYH